uniref:Uncharacterized protein n=1 Tax=Leersia perrieri TaxID=77586 RepID=A0A0D9VU03_9ORYZ
MTIVAPARRWAWLRGSKAVAKVARSPHGLTSAAARCLAFYGVDDDAMTRAVHIFACSGSSRYGSNEFLLAFKENTVAHAFLKTNQSPAVHTFSFL